MFCLLNLRQWAWLLPLLPGIVNKSASNNWYAAITGANHMLGAAIVCIHTSVLLTLLGLCGMVRRNFLYFIVNLKPDKNWDA